MSNLVNRQWTLANRPPEWVSASDFKLAEASVPDPGEGQIVIKVTHVAFEPAQRGWMAENPGYMAPIPIGGVMRSMAAGEVIASRHPDFKAGDKVSGMFGWQEYTVVDAAGALLPVTKLAPGVTEEMALSVLGITGLTAYFGMLEVGQPKAGDVVAVSGAAGATGSIAGQIAKIKGCTVIGIAGGEDKCRWLTEVAGFDAAIDYKAEKVSRRLRELAPDGINVFYDNVGGEILEAALNNLANLGRVAICGAISGYNSGALPPPPKNYMALVWKNATMAGFLLGRFSKQFPQATAQLAEWVKDGKLKFAVDVQQGFENVPATFLRLFQGQNLGKQLCRIA
jgi:NADPH-dependent curcumin reductase CurA